jgi:hypothetical protein
MVLTVHLGIRGWRCHYHGCPGPKYANASGDDGGGGRDHGDGEARGDGRALLVESAPTRTDRILILTSRDSHCGSRVQNAPKCQY